MASDPMEDDLLPSIRQLIASVTPIIRASGSLPTAEEMLMRLEETDENFHRYELVKYIRTRIEDALAPLIEEEIEKQVNEGGSKSGGNEALVRTITDHVINDQACIDLMQTLKHNTKDAVERLVQVFDEEHSSVRDGYYQDKVVSGPDDKRRSFSFSDDSSSLDSSFNQGSYMFMNQEQFSNLAENLEPSQPLETRQEALRRLLQIPPSDVLACEQWGELRQGLLHALSDTDEFLAEKSLNFHARMFSSNSHHIMREVFTSLVEHLKVVCTSNKTKLPLLRDGIDYTNPTHHRIIKKFRLMNEFQVEVPIYWIRYPERFLEEITESSIQLLVAQPASSQPDHICPIHYMSIVDPRATWFKKWLHGNYSRSVVITLCDRYRPVVEDAVGCCMDYISAKRATQDPTNRLADQLAKQHLAKRATQDPTNRLADQLAKQHLGQGIKRTRYTGPSRVLSFHAFGVFTMSSHDVCRIVVVGQGIKRTHYTGPEVEFFHFMHSVCLLCRLMMYAVLLLSRHQAYTLHWPRSRVLSFHAFGVFAMSYHDVCCIVVVGQGIKRTRYTGPEVEFFHFMHSVCLLCRLMMYAVLLLSRHQADTLHWPRSRVLSFHAFSVFTMSYHDVCCIVVVGQGIKRTRYTGPEVEFFHFMHSVCLLCRIMMYAVLLLSRHQADTLHWARSRVLSFYAFGVFTMSSHDVCCIVVVGQGIKRTRYTGPEVEFFHFMHSVCLLCRLMMYAVLLLSRHQADTLHWPRSRVLSFHAFGVLTMSSHDVCCIVVVGQGIKRTRYTGPEVEFFHFMHSGCLLCRLMMYAVLLLSRHQADTLHWPRSRVPSFHAFSVLTMSSHDVCCIVVVGQGIKRTRYTGPEVEFFHFMHSVCLLCRLMMYAVLLLSRHQADTLHWPRSRVPSFHAFGVFTMSYHDVCCQGIKRTRYTGPEVEFFHFMHSVCLLCRLMMYAGGADLFPIQTSNGDVSLHELLVSLVHLITECQTFDQGINSPSVLVTETLKMSCTTEASCSRCLCKDSIITELLKPVLNWLHNDVVCIQGV
ncbi:uncharacterized protein [Amphiura filiformis]|uniref:uncharacterized protein n=1 Tax=Amphiura filiformis TaxID=82378 RepID=UPI003B21B5AD